MPGQRWPREDRRMGARRGSGGTGADTVKVKVRPGLDHVTLIPSVSSLEVQISPPPEWRQRIIMCHCSFLCSGKNPFR